MDYSNQPSQPASSVLNQEKTPTQTAFSIPQQLSSRRVNPSPRLLYIYVISKGLRRRGLTITDSDKTTELYTIPRKPPPKWHVSIMRPSSDQPNGGAPVQIGGIIFRVPRLTELHINGESHLLYRIRSWRVKDVFDSSSAGTLTWISQSSWKISLELVNSRNEVLAKVSCPRFARKRKGRRLLGQIEILSPDIRGNFLDEIVVSAMAVFRKALDNASVATVSAGGGAAAAGGGGAACGCC